MAVGHIFARQGSRIVESRGKKQGMSMCALISSSLLLNCSVIGPADSSSCHVIFLNRGTETGKGS